MQQFFKKIGKPLGIFIIVVNLGILGVCLYLKTLGVDITQMSILAFLSMGAGLITYKNGE